MMVSFYDSLVWESFISLVEKDMIFFFKVWTGKKSSQIGICKNLNSTEMYHSSYMRSVLKTLDFCYKVFIKIYDFPQNTIFQSKYSISFWSLIDSCVIFFWGGRRLFLPSIATIAPSFQDHTHKPVSHLLLW